MPRPAPSRPPAALNLAARARPSGRARANLHRLTPLERYCGYKQLHLLRHLDPPGPDGTGRGRMVVNRVLTPGTFELTSQTYGGDSNLWTGVLLATLALEYGLSKDRSLLHPIRQILDAYQWLEQEQTLVPRAAGYLPRGTELHVVGTGDEFLIEPSGDQYTGILIGLDFTNRFVDDAALRSRIRAQARRIGGYMQDNGYFIFRPQGGLSARGANCVHWEYPWSRMLVRMTGSPYSSNFAFSDFWDRLAAKDRKKIIEVTAIVAGVLATPALIWLAWSVMTLLIPYLLYETNDLIASFLPSVFAGVLAWLVTALGVFGLAPRSVLILLLAFIIALFAVVGEDAIGIFLGFIHGGDARKKYRAAMNIFSGNMPDHLNGLAEILRRLEPVIGSAGTIHKPVGYYNYHVSLLASFGGFFGTNDQELATVEDLYDARIVGEGDRNALFAVMARVLFGRNDAFTQNAIQVLDEPGVFPDQRLPNTWDASVFHNNYAWQHSPAGRRSRAGDVPPKEWPGLDYMFPAILRAHLEQARVPPGCSPAVVEAL